MVINAVAALGLAPIVGWLAPAIATTLAGWAMVVLLMRGARDMGDVARFEARFHTRLWRICLAALLMGAALWGGAELLEPYLFTAGWRYLALAGLVVFGIILFFAIAQVIGAVKLSDFKRTLARR